MYYLQHPVNPPVYPVSPVILSKNLFSGLKKIARPSRLRSRKGHRISHGPSFVSGADADGDVGVPGGAGRVMGQGGCLGLQSWAMPEDGPPKVDWSKITISKIYLLLELLCANGHSWYLDRFG